jgi:hypothetical protein
MQMGAGMKREITSTHETLIAATHDAHRILLFLFRFLERIVI